MKTVGVDNAVKVTLAVARAGALTHLPQQTSNDAAPAPRPEGPGGIQRQPSSQHHEPKRAEPAVPDALRHQD